MTAGESLLDTFPGRLFIEQLRSIRLGDMPSMAFVAAMQPEELLWCATYAVRRYLYSEDCMHALDLDVNEPELREFDNAGLAALSRLSTFDSPQIHHGTGGDFREPTITNRDGFNALPAGAFWTSTPITDDEDTWSVSGEQLRHDSSRWTVYFDVTRVRVTRIDSGRDWINLIESHPLTGRGCKYPDWPAIAESWDAVHLSPAGLLLAHPPISTAPFLPTDGSGLTHSQPQNFMVARVLPWRLLR